MSKFKKIILRQSTIITLICIKSIAFYLFVGINPLSGLLAVFTMLILLSVYFALVSGKSMKATIGFAIIYSVVTTWMFADTLYYGYFNEFTSVNQFWQMSNLVVVNDSFKFVMPPISVIFFLDIPFVITIFNRLRKDRKVNLKKQTRLLFTSVAIFVPLIIAMLPFNINMVIRNQKVEFFTYHVKDAIDNLLLDGRAEEIPIIQILTDIKVEKPEDIRYHGIGKGKNLIVIQIESLQNFVINAKYNGQELTPVLNELIGNDSIYFSNYYQTIGKGNTADAEFTSQNSIYPVTKGESYRLYESNSFKGLPWIMRELGYDAYAFHGYEENFWNRKDAYINQGFQDFISQEDFESTENIGFGLSDVELFRQTANRLAENDGLFYSFIITLTNHHPYELPEDKKVIQLKSEDEGTVFGNYLQSIYYTDSAIGQFIEDLKEKGLYEDSVIALYGDHHGLNCNDNEIKEDMSNFLGYEYDFYDMLNVPFILHLPGSNLQERIDTVGGQIDFMPTMANIMGADISDNPYVLGQDLVNAKEGFMASVTYMLEGSFINDEVLFEFSRDGIFENSRAVDLKTHKEVDVEKYREESQRAIDLLQTSKYILDLNLLKELNK